VKTSSWPFKLYVSRRMALIFCAALAPMAVLAGSAFATPSAGSACTSGVLVSDIDGKTLFCSGGFWTVVNSAGVTVSDRISSSGSQAMVLATPGGTISFTTGSTAGTAYLDSTGRFITPGISATTNQTSVTSLYASGNVGIGTTAPIYPLEVFSATSYIKLDPAAPKISWYKPGIIGNVDFSTGAAVYSIPIQATGSVVASGGGLFTGAGTSVGNAGTVSLRPSSGSDGFLTWTENGVATRGLLGFAAGSGDLVYRSGASTFATGTERLRITSSGCEWDDRLAGIERRGGDDH
jgi:hypothetical protein